MKIYASHTKNPTIINLIPETNVPMSLFFKSYLCPGFSPQHWEKKEGKKKKREKRLLKVENV
jgi:hypothetical protein